MINQTLIAHPSNGPKIAIVTEDLDKDLLNGLGARITLARQSAGYMKQVDFANAIGTSPQALNMYENGKREPNRPLVFKIAALTGVTLDFLYLGDIRHLPYEKAQVLLSLAQSQGHELPSTPPPSTH